MGFPPAGGTAEEFHAQIRADIEHGREVVQRAGVKVG